MSSDPRRPVSVATTISTAASDNEGQATEMTFNVEDLMHVLYGKKKGSAVDLLHLQKERRKERSCKTYCLVCHVDRPPNGCPFHEPASTYTSNHDDSLSYAIKSFPAEVQLCTSSIPGAMFGVCAKRDIPEGTWIGPYEGRRVSPEELSVFRDNSYIWEIYEEGQPCYYIDGSDESSSSWMRFIRCARHKDEQNLYAFQYLGNIFYRSFKEIPKETEMLVWYDEKYPQHLGIPTGLQEIEFISSSDLVKNSNCDKSSNTATKSKDDPRHTVDQDKEKFKETDTNRTPKDYPTRLMVRPAESHQRVMAAPLSHRSRPSSFPSSTRISHAPHSLNSSPSFPPPELTSLSSPAIPHATVAPHYTLPRVPIPPVLQSTTPPRVYGVGYRHPVPVNISAGIPVSISGRGQLGITGTHLPRVHQEVLDERPVIISSTSDGHYRSGLSTSPMGGINRMDRNHESLQRKRVLFSSNVVESDMFDETSQPIIKRKVTDSTTVDPDIRHYPSLTRRKSPLPNVLEESNVEKEKGWTNRPRTPKERIADERESERTRTNTKSHRLHLSKEEHISKTSSRVTSAWPSDESQSQDEVAGESSDSNSTSSTKNEMSSIDEISMWRCRQCQKTFTQRVLLQVHVCPQQPLKPYRCGQCEHSFATSTELRSHVETHASEKPFKCGFCSRSFAGATTLNNHIRTHMGKRPFNCEHCGKTFAQAGQLARHQRTPGDCDPRATKS